MVRDYNHDAAKCFADSLRDGLLNAAQAYAEAVTSDENAVNYGVAPDKEYNDVELAELIEANLKGIDGGRWI